MVDPSRINPDHITVDLGAMAQLKRAGTAVGQATKAVGGVAWQGTKYTGKKAWQGTRWAARGSKNLAVNTYEVVRLAKPSTALQNDGQVCWRNGDFWIH